MKSNTQTDRIVRLDVNDYEGNLLERWKAKVTDRKIGRIIILRLKEIFNFNDREIFNQEKEELNEELKLQRELNKVTI